MVDSIIDDVTIDIVVNLLRNDILYEYGFKFTLHDKVIDLHMEKITKRDFLDIHLMKKH